jgi:hypothetical protein
MAPGSRLDYIDSVEQVDADTVIVHYNAIFPVILRNLAANSS